eukprot:2076429-Rhodomonas_salina.1
MALCSSCIPSRRSPSALGMWVSGPPFLLFVALLAAVFSRRRLAVFCSSPGSAIRTVSTGHGIGRRGPEELANLGVPDTARVSYQTARSHTTSIACYWDSAVDYQDSILLGQRSSLLGERTTRTPQ